jgi:hypothetical protein
VRGLLQAQGGAPGTSPASLAARFFVSLASADERRE